MNRLTLVLLSQLVTAFMMNSASSNQSFVSTDDYIKALGEIAVLKDTNVLRAQAVFQRLTQVTDRIAGSHIRLVVVNSDTRPWAIAVPDGGIILSKGALEFCYQDSSEIGPEIGDTRLAFVLGHELSHLTAGDFWHQNVHLQFSNRPEASDIDRIRETLARAAGVSSDADVNDFLVRLRERELIADDNGFLIAAIAGYDVSTLVENDQQNFLHQWITETGGYSEISHFSADERTAFLRQRLARLRARSLLFDVAVRLGFSGYTTEAIRLLHEFEQDFPSKQVFNNLGYFYLKSALKVMPESIAARWWFPVIATMEIPAGIQSTRSIGGVGARATEYLDKARRYLELAIQADAGYVTALLNLASTEYFLDNPHAARAHIESVLKLDPDNIHAISTQAPLLVAQNPEIDMSTPALAVMEDLVKREDAGESVWFNYARLLDESDNKQAAEEVWRKLTSGSNALPGMFDGVVCERLRKPKGCSASDGVTSSRGASDNVDSYLGSNIDENGVRQQLVEWERQSYPTEIGEIEIYKDDSGELLVVRDSVVIFVSLPRAAVDSAKIMVSELAKPRFQTQLASGTLRQYGDGLSIFSDGPMIREYWYSASQ